MENITVTIDGVEYNLVPANATATAASGPPELTIERPFVVYAADGTRVDGYKFESRARRNNGERFAGSGYWFGKVDPADFEWVPC